MAGVRFSGKSLGFNRDLIHDSLTTSHLIRNFLSAILHLGMVTVTRSSIPRRVIRGT
jgi:hypothetical protein